MLEYDERLKGLETCEVLVCSVLEFGKIRVLFFYHLRAEKLKGIPDKVELVEDVTDFFRED